MARQIHLPRALCAAVTLLLAWPAYAGRPLSADDAATAGASTCQLEGWFERTSAQRAWVVSPACGIGESFELGFEGVRPSPRDGTQFTGTVAVKWVPAGTTVETPLGKLDFGAKFAAGHVKPEGASWRRQETSVLALASLAPSERWSFHVNAGALRDRAAGVDAALLNVAVVFQPGETWQVFVEALANDRRAVLGGVVRGAGARWWAVKDRVGIDLTASRQAGGGGGTLWTVGFGWYGIGD